MTRYALSFACGLLGVLVALAAWHLYLDHRNLHALVDLVRQSQSRQDAAAPK